MSGVRIPVRSPLSRGFAKSVRHSTLTATCVGSSPASPAKLNINDPLAQSVEHLTFNQGVPRSSRGWITIGEVSEWFKELVLKTSDA